MSKESSTAIKQNIIASLLETILVKPVRWIGDVWKTMTDETENNNAVEEIPDLSELEKIPELKDSLKTVEGMENHQLKLQAGTKDKSKTTTRIKPNAVKKYDGITIEGVPRERD